MLFMPFSALSTICYCRQHFTPQTGCKYNVNLLTCVLSISYDLREKLWCLTVKLTIKSEVFSYLRRVPSITTYPASATVPDPLPGEPAAVRLMVIIVWGRVETIPKSHQFTVIFTYTVLAGQ